jgi:outer membrane protein TolC
VIAPLVALAGMGLCAAVWTAAAAAAEPITLDAVYRRAFEKNEQIEIARRGVAVAEQDERRARSAILPRLTLDAG